MTRLYNLLLIFLLSDIFSGVLFSQVPDLGNDTIICKGSTRILDAGIENTDAFDIFWNDETQPSGLVKSITQGGKYKVKVKNKTTNEIASDSINITEVNPPEFNIIHPISERGYFCKGEKVDLRLSNTRADWVYLWEGLSSTLSTATIDTSGDYRITVIDENGCDTKKSVKLDFQFPYEEDRIILTTWDPSVERNIIIWKTTLEKRTQSYILNRGNESNELGIFSYNSVNLTVDHQWDPRNSAAVYNLQLIDSCNNRSLFKTERMHKTMHLSLEKIEEPQAATKLSWNPYIGFDYEYFFIYKGSASDNMVLIDSVLNSGKDMYTFIDLTPESDIFFYQVLVRTPDTIHLRGGEGKKASPGPFVHSLSNLEDNRRVTGLNQTIEDRSDIRVFPNPYSGSTTIKYTLNKSCKVRLEIFNLLGQRVILLQNGEQAQGNYQIPFSARENGFSPGLYYLKYQINDKEIVTKKLIER